MSILSAVKAPFRPLYEGKLRPVIPAIARFLLERLRSPEVRSTLEHAGYTVDRKDNYSSPLPSVPELRSTRSRWDKPSSLAGVAFDVNEMENCLRTLLSRYTTEFFKYPPYEELSKIGFGPGYTAIDALTLYMFIRDTKPRHYVEVGSGLSTYYASLAAARNSAEGHPMKITCVEPCPYKKLTSIEGISILQKQVQDVPVSFFQGLQRGDLLFIDSSHIVRIDGDVPFIYLEVLPCLPGDLIIHIHDIPFPFNFPYPPDHWILGKRWPVFWNEAMLLQAFLAFNSRFRVILSLPLMRHFNEAFLRHQVPGYSPVDIGSNVPSSIWLRTQNA